MDPHPLVVKLLGICLDWPGKSIAVLFEYHPGGTLEDYIRAKHVSDGGGEYFVFMMMVLQMHR